MRTGAEKSVRRKLSAGGRFTATKARAFEFSH